MRFVYRDDRIVGVDKPAGIQTHRGFGETEPALLQQVRDELDLRVHPCHRLDRPTSGIVVFALDPQAAAHLALQFRHAQVKKRYLAWVRGRPPEFGVLDHPVPRTKDGPRVPARTHFCRHHFRDGYSLMEAAPVTGRYHQIRRHMKHMSAPILGDVRYGDGRHNRRLRSEFGLHRLALHAFELELAHPDDDRALRLLSPLAPDLFASLCRWDSNIASRLPPSARPGVEHG